MAVAMVRDLKYVIRSLLGKGEVMQDLEYSMRTKGDLTRLEEARLRVYREFATTGFAKGAGIYSFIGWFMTGIGPFGRTFIGAVRMLRRLRLCVKRLSAAAVL